MRTDTLPSPGMLSMGINLQSTMARAISAVELQGAVPGAGGKTHAAKTLDNFLVAARTAIAGFIDAVVPSRGTMTVRPSEPDRVVIRFNKELDRKFVPAVGVFVIAGTVRTVTRVDIDGPDVVLTLNAPFASGNAYTVTYNAPGVGSNGVRDLSGNLVASWAATAGTPLA